MRLTVIGGGAVGLVFAALLSKVDQVALLVRRSEQERAIAEAGVRIDGPDSSATYRLDVSTDPGIMSDSDLVIVLTKTYDTDAVAKTVAANTKQDVCVLTLQNGIGSVDVLNEACGKSRVLCGITRIASHRNNDRHAVYSTLNRVAVGEQQAPATARCHEIAHSLNSVGFEAVASDDGVREVWTKLALSIAQNALCALTDMPFGALRKSKPALSIVRSSLDEFELLAKAEGIELLVDPYEQLMINWSIVPQHHSSMWQDMKAGQRTEIDAMNGAIVRLGKGHGIPMPVNETIAQLVRVVSSLPN